LTGTKMLRYKQSSDEDVVADCTHGEPYNEKKNEYYQEKINKRSKQ
jgi:hypothetical protein